MQKPVVLNRSKLLGFKLQPKEGQTARVVTGAKIGKPGPPPPPAPVRD